MALRYCSYGQHGVEEDTFSWQNKSAGKRNSICKPCNSTRGKIRYSESPSERQAVKDRTARYVARNELFVYEYLLDHPCVDCGEPEPLFLDFDHLRDKEAGVSYLANSPSSIQRLKDEIAKCEVVCVRCHRLRTAKRAGWYRYRRMTQ